MHKCWHHEWLHHDISKVLTALCWGNCEATISYFVSQEEVCNVDMLHPLEVLWVIGNCMHA